MHGTLPDWRLTPELLLSAYAAGVFPMAEAADEPELMWLDPQRRGILPLDDFHIPRRLVRTVRQDVFDIRVDSAFRDTMLGCALRPETWINEALLAAYAGLHRIGHAHSVEAWRDDTLVGGLYGVRLGGAFFGESMFSRETDASKVALVHLVARLRKGGFTLLDTQFTTAHLRSFGVIEIPRLAYRARLDEAVRTDAVFDQPFDGVDDILFWATGDAPATV